MSMRIGVYTATRWEQDAVRRAITLEERREVAGVRWVVGRRAGARVFIVQGGVGPLKAESAWIRFLAAEKVDAAISSGYACALTQARAGALLIGTEVVGREALVRDRETGPVYPCAADLQARAAAVAKQLGLASVTGRIVTIPRVVVRAEEKRAIAAESQAVGLDMESAAVAAASGNVPLAVIRTVSDVVEEDLPLDFNLFLRPVGSGGLVGLRAWLQGAVAALAHPARLAGLNRLRKQAALASQRLTEFYSGFLEQVA
jgi:adenosylhomocysteine nucleosidase